MEGRGYFKRNVVCCSLCVGCASVMGAFAGTTLDVTASMWAVNLLLCMLLKPLRETSHPRIRLPQPPCGTHAHYLGYHSLCGATARSLWDVVASVWTAHLLQRLLQCLYGLQKPITIIPIGKYEVEVEEEELRQETKAGILCSVKR